VGDSFFEYVDFPSCSIVISRVPACFISSFLPTAPSPSDALGGVFGLVAPSQNCRQGTLNALSEAASKGGEKVPGNPGAISGLE